MARITDLTVECGFCGTRFHSNAFTDTGVLEAALAGGYSTRCTKCAKDVLCNKRNTTWAVEESGPGGGIEFK